MGLPITGQVNTIISIDPRQNLTFVSEELQLDIFGILSRLVADCLISKSNDIHRLFDLGVSYGLFVAEN